MAMAMASLPGGLPRPGRRADPTRFPIGMLTRTMGQAPLVARSQSARLTRIRLRCRAKRPRGGPRRHGLRSAASGHRATGMRHRDLPQGVDAFGTYFGDRVGDPNATARRGASDAGAFLTGVDQARAHYLRD